MKKILSLALVCLALVSSTAFAEPVTQTTMSSSTIPTLIYPEYRGYTGFKIHDKGNEEGKITLQAYHMKMDNKDMFWYYVQCCTYNDDIGTCSFLSSNSWIEGKVAGNNWIIRNENIDAVLGRQIGHIKTDSFNARLEIE